MSTSPEPYLIAPPDLPAEFKNNPLDVPDALPPFKVSSGRSRTGRKLGNQFSRWKLVIDHIKAAATDEELQYLADELNVAKQRRCVCKKSL